MKTAVNNLAKLESEITDLVTELYELFSDANCTVVADDCAILDRYIKHVARIGLHVRKSDITGLQDFCVTFQEILRGIRNQERNLTAEEREQLEIWPSLVLSAISASSKTEYINEFIDYIQNSIWNDVIPGDHVIKFRDSFTEDSADNIPEIMQDTPIDHQTPAVVAVENVETVHDHGRVFDNKEEANDNENIIETQDDFDNPFFEIVQQEILEATSELLSDLSDENNDISASLILCADRIEILASSISTSGHIGLMDICSYYQLGLRHLAELPAPLSQEQIESIEVLPALLLSYIACPEDAGNVDSILDFLNNTSWITSFTDSEAGILKELLAPEIIEIKQPEDDFAPVEDKSSSAESQTMKNDSVLNESSDFDAPQQVLEDNEDEGLNFQTNELINLVIDEIKIEKETLSICLQTLSKDNNLESRLSALTDFNNIIERFTLALESVGLSGLYQILSHIKQNLQHWIKEETLPESKTIDFLALLPDFTLNYLSNIENIKFSEDLVNVLFLSDWPLTLNVEKDALITELVSPEISVEEEPEERATVASESDVSLKLPEDVNQQLLNSLLQELPVQTSEFNEIVTKIYNGNADLQDVQHAQRIAHTLKGAANTVGVVGVATLTHHIEDILTAFSKHSQLPGKTLSDILMNAADVLEMMSEALLGIGEAPAHAQTILQQILDWANRIDHEGIPEDSTSSNLTEHANTENPTQATSHKNEHVTQDDTNTTMLRVPATLMDELLRLAGESIIMGAQLQERLKQATLKNELTQQQNGLFQQLVFDLEQIVDIQRLTSKQSHSELTTVFDTLELEQYNELHTITHRLIEAVTDSKELTQSIDDELSELDGLLADQSRIHKESQDVVMQTRMVPVQNIVPRLHRSIRQTCRSTNKQVILEVNGSDIMMDSDILNDIAEPLMHILRNAVDHGIESSELRKSKNKSETGHVTLDFFREGEQIVIRCSDDGAGLDFENIRNTAINKGLLGASNNVSDDELTHYIWMPGFTTSKEMTQVSGRGIGMDAVYNRVTSKKGTLKIDSTKDVGCIVEIHLPFTLISVHSILVKHFNQTLAVSNRGIEQILGVEDGILEENAGDLTYHYADITYEAFDIETLLHQPAIDNIERAHRSILLVNDETGKPYAITVQQVIANQELVVKQLGSYVPEIAGIEGATILGNGNVVPVLDLPGLIRTAHLDDITPIIDATQISESDLSVETINALVVDDSLSARRSLAEFVEDIGYSVRTARDGIDAIDKIEDKLPDILLVDLEMPRMNGLELTSHLRANDNTRNLPIIMVTSRSTEKHRKIAMSLGVNAYITKPFSEDELLDYIDTLLSHTD